ncbi:unnamed protein product [Amaranthus hypochondriacus]
MGKEIQQTSSYTVHELVALNPYNPDILPDLENHVNHQVMTGLYSLEANLCLLRLYQHLPLLQIRCIMSVSSTSILIATLFVIRSKLTFSPSLVFITSTNLEGEY